MPAKLAACLPSTSYQPSQPYIGGYGRGFYHDDLHDHGDHGNYDDLVCNQLIDQVQEGAL